MIEHFTQKLQKMIVFIITIITTHPHLLHNCMKKYTPHLNKQRYKRRSRICLTMKHSVDRHSDRVGVWTRLWNYVWIHRAGLLGYFEWKLLSGGVVLKYFQQNCICSDGHRKFSTTFNFDASVHSSLFDIYWGIGQEPVSFCCKFRAS